MERVARAETPEGAPGCFRKSWNTFWRNFPPSRLKPFEPPTTRSSGTRFRIGPTEELELFSGLAISLCLFSLPTGPLASPRLRSHPRYTISTLWIPFDFPIHLISAPFGLLSGVSTLFPRTQIKRKVLLIIDTPSRFR